MERKTFYESPLIQEMSLDLEQVLCASVNKSYGDFGFAGITEAGDVNTDWI